MAGGNFLHRVLSYVVNEVLVNSLANRYYLSLFFFFISKGNYINREKRKTFENNLL